MSIVSGIVVYLIIWWMVLFMVLPWGVHQSDTLIPGQEPGAPDTPNLKKKFFITTGLASVLWLITYFLIQLDLYSFYD